MTPETNDDPYKAEVLRWFETLLPEKYKDSRGNDQSVWRVHYERNHAIGFSVCTVVNAISRQSFLYGWGNAPDINNSFREPDQDKVKALVETWRKEVSKNAKETG